MTAFARVRLGSPGAFLRVAQAALALALLIAVVGWRDSDPILRWAMPAIGATGIAAAVATRGMAAGRWLAIAADAWFVLFGVMLSLSVIGDMAGVSGQYDPGPAVIAHLGRLQAWLDPAVQRPVAATFLIAGTVGIIAAGRLRVAGDGRQGNP